jgi:hypothetical protein
MRHLLTFARMIAQEIRLVITKVLDILASPYWKLYNKLHSRKFRRENPERFDSEGNWLSYCPVADAYVRDEDLFQPKSRYL